MSALPPAGRIAICRTGQRQGRHCKGPAVKKAGVPARSQRHGNRQHQQRISERIPFHVAKPFSRILLETGPHRPNGRLSRTTAYLNLHCHLTGLSTHLRENT
jgi:hypothetical protein